MFPVLIIPYELQSLLFSFPVGPSLQSLRFILVVSHAHIVLEIAITSGIILLIIGDDTCVHIQILNPWFIKIHSFKFKLICQELCEL